MKLRLAAAVAVVGAAVGLAAPPARASALCPEGGVGAGGPLPGGNGPVDFGTIPEACGTPELALRARGALLVASSMPDYYGSVLADAMLRGRRPVGTRGWLTVALDMVTFRYIDNAGIVAQGWSFGPLTVAYDRTVVTSARVALAAYARALVPLDTARQNSLEAGLELGASTRVRLGARWAFDGGAALAAPLDVTGGQPHAQLQPVALGEAWFAPRPTVALAAGAALKLQAAPTFSLVTLAPRATARFALRHHFWAALLVEVPVVGSDRTDLVGSLFLGLGP